MLRVLCILTAGLVCVVALGFAGVFVMSELRLGEVSRGTEFNHVIPTDQASIEHGRHIARTRGCFGCHGQQLEGMDFGQQWDWPERAVAPNLAAYARAHDAVTMEAAIRQGIGANGKALVSMPSYNFTLLTDEDTAALIAFLKSAPVAEKKLPKPKLGWNARWKFVVGKEAPMVKWVQAVPPLQVDADAEPQRARGEYLAMTMCNECHGLDLRGATLWDAVTPDLVLVASIPRDEFETLIKTGVGIGGRDLGLMGLVAPDRFPYLTKQEIDDLYVYLSSLINEPPPEGVFWRP